MTCRDFIEFLLQYQAGELPATERGVFDHHLSLCKACRDYLANYRRTIALEKTAFGATDEPIPAAVPEALVQAILAARRRDTGGGT
jgi:anti-sigma factor RsiW